MLDSMAWTVPQLLTIGRRLLPFLIFFPLGIAVAASPLKSVFPEITLFGPFALPMRCNAAFSLLPLDALGPTWPDGARVSPHRSSAPPLASSPVSASPSSSSSLLVVELEPVIWWRHLWTHLHTVSFATSTFLSRLFMLHRKTGNMTGLLTPPLPCSGAWLGSLNSSQ
jgi:hypothetical protein